jgi:hypothetical protein
MQAFVEVEYIILDILGGGAQKAESRSPRRLRSLGEPRPTPVDCANFAVYTFLRNRRICSVTLAALSPLNS